jgi:divalent metal cation (Fe/Co/Zn/Cd) transporter
MTFIDFHLVVPGTMSVDAAHAICDGIELKLREAGGAGADHHPRRTREQGEALRHRGGVRESEW